MKTYILLLHLIIISCSLLGQQDCDSALFKKGQQLFKNNQFEASAKVFTQVLQKCPMFTAAYLNRGICNYNLQNLKTAISDFDSTILIAKFKYKLATHIANIFFDLKDYDLAKKYFERASGLNESESESYFKIGRCLWLSRIKILQQNKVEDYQKDSVLVLYLKEKIVSLYNKGIYLDSIKNYTYYQSESRDASSDMSTNYEYWFDRAIIEANFSEYSKALKDYETSIMIHPTITAYYYAAYLAKKIGQNKKACEYIQTWSSLYNPSENTNLFKKQEEAKSFCKGLGIETK